MSAKYGDATGYDRYMGGWSAALSPRFIAFAGVMEPVEALDVGCGTGNLLVALRAKFPAARLTGIDPSEALLSRARERPELAGVSLETDGVEVLPFADGRFTHTLSMLVLQEFVDRPRALAEMRRVTRTGGLVAACQWDFARMPVIDTLMAAIAAVDGEASERIHRMSPRVFEDEAELEACWVAAGLHDVAASRIAVSRRFESFDVLWQSLFGGSTPSTLTLASFSTPQQHDVYERMRSALAPAGDPVDITAEALVVKGTA